MSRVTYEDLHWGKKPARGEIDVKQVVGPTKVVGEIKAVSYASDKGERGKIYRHEFERHDGRGPYLLIEADDGADDVIRIENPTPVAHELGRVVDFELTDGRRLVVGGAFLGANPDDGTLVVVSERGVPYQIEQRADAHFVSERGVEE